MHLGESDKRVRARIYSYRKAHTTLHPEKGLHSDGSLAERMRIAMTGHFCRDGWVF